MLVVIIVADCRCIVELFSGYRSLVGHNLRLYSPVNDRVGDYRSKLPASIGVPGPGLIGLFDAQIRATSAASVHMG